MAWNNKGTFRPWKIPGKFLNLGDLLTDKLQMMLYV